MHMKWILTCLLAACLGSAALAQPEAALVKAVQAKLNKVNDYVASGRMRLDVSFIKAPPSAVTVYYKKPDRFRIRKSDGLSILPKGGVSTNLGSILGGGRYTVIPAGTATVKGTTTKVVKLLPLEEESDIVLTTLYIDEKALLIRKTAVTTRESGSYEMELDFGRYAAWGLPDKVVFLFNTADYKLPKGITFEYEKGEPKKAPPKNSKGRVEITYASYTINRGVDNKVFQ